MTSTEFTVGLDGSRVSSKVLKPPGGGSSDIFGLGGSNPQKKDVDNSTKNRLFGDAPVNTNKISTPSRTKSNIFMNENETTVTPKKQFVRRNPITGEGITAETAENLEKENEENEAEVEEKITEKNGNAEPPKPESAKVVQTSIRVRAPPGGKSSGIF